MTERPTIPIPNMRGGPPVEVDAITCDPEFWAELAALEAEADAPYLALVPDAEADDWDGDEGA